MNREIVLAYFGGLFDGDGSFSLIKRVAGLGRSPLYYPMVQFANADVNLVDYVLAYFGGAKYCRKPHVSPKGVIKKASYQWKLEKSPKCVPFLEQIIPYLIVKQLRAKFLLDYLQKNPFVRGSNKLKDHVLARREKAFLKMRLYNSMPDINSNFPTASKRFNSNNPIFWAYVAGLMDTDGSFSLKKEMRKSGGSKSPVYTATILLTMTDARAIQHIAKNFAGGSCCIVKAKTTAHGFCYRFSISSKKDCIQFLVNCLPYLRLKKAAAEQLLFYCQNVKSKPGARRLTAEELQFREDIYCNIKELNDGVGKSLVIDLEPEALEPATRGKQAFSCAA